MSRAVVQLLHGSADNLVEELIAGAGRPCATSPRLAGVSYKTVSRVVNNEPGVSPALADRVRRASAQLDYHPNHTASSLRRGDRRTSSLGLILEDVGNPFSGAMYRAVEDVALARGVTVLAGSCEEDATRALHPALRVRQSAGRRPDRRCPRPET